MSVRIWVRVRMKVEVTIMYTKIPLVEKFHVLDVLTEI